MHRRTFLKLAGGVPLATLLPESLVRADDSTPLILVPEDKGLSAGWLQSLTARGEPEVYRGEELKHVGMPVGGLCAGLLYLGGDGKLWLWDIFNRNTTQKKITYAGQTFSNSDGSVYVEPLVPKSPLAQGFAIKYTAGSLSGERTLDRDGGWAEIAFQGPYPLATVNYRDPAVPVSVTLEAFSPFIPLSFDDSSLPATILRYTVTNTGDTPAQVEMGGWLENVVLAVSSKGEAVVRENQLLHDEHGQGVLLTGQLPAASGLPSTPDILFADFSSGTYEGWTADGPAFGTSPVARKDLPGYLQDLGGQGDYVAASHNFRVAPDQRAADDLTGRLTSREFMVERRFITFLSSGGHRPHEAGVRLLIDGQPVLEQTGDNRNHLDRREWDVEKYLGRKGVIEIFDDARGAWGNVYATNFVFSDRSQIQPAAPKRHDFGTMALYQFDPAPGGSAVVCLPAGNPAHGIFNDSLGGGKDANPSEHPVAAIRQAFTLAPGEHRTVDFVLAWHFPNVDPRINGPDVIHSYAARFPDASAVARYVAANFPRLVAGTKTWAETWNDSTLPHWFLARTFNNLCNLATTTSYRFANGQFWAWEGIYSCEGTCTHVWGYAQAMARIFPELERALREKTDYAFAQDPHDGTIQYRGTHGGFAADGQAGIILRTYREHQMSADDSFLKPLWPRVRLAMDRLITQVNDKGLLDGPQHNTLDTAWYGEVAWISGLYLAALRAAEEMARVCGDADYASRCRQLFDLGSRSLVPELFNGEYFINKVDSRHLDAINSGTGCEIDQLMGQSWAWQVGLGRIFPQKETLTALRSLWRYNFTPDAGRYHLQMKVGRWYALPGEAGLLICTFPKPDWSFQQAAGKGPAWAALYFNECQSGYEHEVASHMVAEGMVTEGLAVLRAIHDRYAAAKRNPFNEVECGDHYSRAMASYGSFVSACGFEYRGPDGYISFAPRLTPEKFKAAFTSAEGWGSFAQEGSDAGLKADLTLKWGTLGLTTVALRPVAGFQPKEARVQLDGQTLAAILDPQTDRVEVRLGAPVKLTAGQTLTVRLV